MQTNNVESSANFYCSQKFWWLTVDISKIQTQSCCAAAPAKIDLKWLRSNPGKIFNSPEMQQERESMLSNIKVDSCSASCWQAEQQGLMSRRLISDSQIRTHTEVEATPRMLHIVIGNNCNMTCVYCCKQYSSAWAHDIRDNGNYSEVITLDDRFTLNNTDQILLKLSQKDISNANSTQLLLDEINKLVSSSNLEEVTITGGEPFLYLGLQDLVNSIPSHIKVTIWTGLGVNTSRFARELDKLPQQINVHISAESTNKLYEFIRYGNSWSQLNNNIDVLRDKKVSYSFCSVISNLTLSGLPDFISWANDAPIIYQPCTDPDFLSAHVMDSYTKEQILNSLSVFPLEIQKIITQSVEQSPTSLQRTNFKNYLTTFAQRRGLSLEVFSPSLINWASNTKIYSST